MKNTSKLQVLCLGKLIGNFRLTKCYQKFKNINLESFEK